MNATQLSVGTTPTKQYDPDDGRQVLSIRNDDPLIDIYVQWGQVTGRIGYPIKAGEVLFLDRGDLSDSVWLWADTATDLIYGMVG